MLQRKHLAFVTCAFLALSAGLAARTVFALGSTPQAQDGACPLLLLDGSAKGNTIRVHVKNTTDEEISGIRFNCKLVDAAMDKSYHASCIEENAHLAAHSEITTAYVFESDLPGPILVSINTITFAGGKSWKPKDGDKCEILKLIPGK